MRQVAIIAAVLGMATIFAIGSRTAHAAPLSTTKTTAYVSSTKQTDPVVTVKPGDNLSTIASTYASTALRIFYANTQIVDPNLIYPDQQLRIPSASEQLTPRATALDSSQSDDTSDVTSDQTTATPSSAPQPVAEPTQTASAPSATGNVWDELANCESSGDWSIDTGNGFYGGLQFTLQSWQAVGGTGYPNEASRAEQIALAKKLEAVQGWNAWPACSAELGL